MKNLLLTTLALSGAAAAQIVPLNGFDHEPVGQAQLSVQNGKLVVDNFSGLMFTDAVRTLLGGAEFYTVEFTAEDADKAPPGPFVSLRTNGNVGGANGKIWDLEVENLGGAFGISMAPGAVSITEARVLAFNEGEQIAEVEVPIPGPGDIIIEVPPFGCRVDPVWTMGPLPPIPGGPILNSTWALFEFDGAEDVTIPAGLRDMPTTVSADLVAIEILHTTPIGALSSAELFAANVPSLTILEETLGYEHHEHMALGDAKFAMQNGELTILGIGSSGLDGVCLDLAGPLSDTEDNGLAVPLTPIAIGPGRALHLEAFGGVGGQTSQLGFAEMKNSQSSTEVIADFSSLGGTKARVVGLLNGNVVVDTVVDQGVVGSFDEPVVLNSCGKLPPDFEIPPFGPIIIMDPPAPPCFLIGLEIPATLDLGGGFLGASTHLVDELRLLAVDVPPVEGLERFDITGRNLGSITLKDEITLWGNAFEDLGGADPGSNGDTLLGAAGTLVAGAPTAFSISNGFAFSPAIMFFALSEAAVPFKGGVLQAFPVVGNLSLFTDGLGNVFLSFPWPAGLPAGLTPVFQAAIADPGASKGVALTNAVKGLTH